VMLSLTRNLMRTTTSYDCAFHTFIHFFPPEDICIKYLLSSVLLGFLVARYPLLLQRCFKILLGATGKMIERNIDRYGRHAIDSVYFKAGVFKTWIHRRKFKIRSHDRICWDWSSSYWRQEMGDFEGIH
jgi:hypothetical protein